MPQISKASAGELQKWKATVQQLPESYFRAAPPPLEMDEALALEESLTLEALLRKVKSY